MVLSTTLARLVLFQGAGTGAAPVRTTSMAKNLQEKIGESDEYQTLLDKIQSEGFTYALTDWDWELIKDTKFHSLRKQFIDLHKQLFDYIGEEAD